MAGRSDDIIPWRAIEHAATEIHGAVVLPLDDQGHWLLRDAPDRVVAALRAFLDGEGTATVAPVPDAPLRSRP